MSDYLEKFQGKNIGRAVHAEIMTVAGRSLENFL